MAKRSSQGAAPVQPTARKKRRTLIGTLVRVIAIGAGVLLVLFLAGGWYYSGEIRSAALEPPTSEPPNLEWEVTSTGSSISLTASSGTGQAGEEGVSGILWENGYSQSDRLVSSTDEGGTTTDVRAMEADQQGPPVGVMAQVDRNYWEGDPMTALGIPFEKVFYASDIGSFPAWYIEGSSDTWAIIVHGKGGTLEESLRILPMFQDLGYHIMVINYRNDIGEARDPSGYHQYGKTEWIDLSGAVKYAHEHGASDHVLFGHSMGGAIVTSFLTQSPLRNFTKAAILDSPILSFEGTVDFQAANTDTPIFGFPVPDLLTTFAKKISSWRFDINWEDTDYLSESHVANLHTPMLIFHGTNDDSVPHSTSVELASVRPDIATLDSTTAGHLRSWNIDPEGFEIAVVEFLDGLD